MYKYLDIIWWTPASLLTRYKIACLLLYKHNHIESNVQFLSDYLENYTASHAELSDEHWTMLFKEVVGRWVVNPHSASDLYKIKLCQANHTTSSFMCVECVVKQPGTLSLHTLWETGKRNSTLNTMEIHYILCSTGFQSQPVTVSFWNFWNVELPTTPKQTDKWDTF